MDSHHSERHITQIKAGLHKRSEATCVWQICFYFQPTHGTVVYRGCIPACVSLALHVFNSDLSIFVCCESIFFCFTHIAAVTQLWVLPKHRWPTLLNFVSGICLHCWTHLPILLHYMIGCCEHLLSEIKMETYESFFKSNFHLIHNAK